VLIFDCNYVELYHERGDDAEQYLSGIVNTELENFNLKELTDYLIKNYSNKWSGIPPYLSKIYKYETEEDDKYIYNSYYYADYFNKYMDLSILPISSDAKEFSIIERKVTFRFDKDSGEIISKETKIDEDPQF
jgi:hypothetical protein